MAAADQRGERPDPVVGLARTAFGVAVVLSPFRARVELVERPEPPIYGDFTDILVFWSDFAVVAAIALWLVSLATRQRPVAWAPVFVRWPGLALVVFAWLSVATSVDVPLSAYAALRMSVLVAFALFVINEIHPRRHLLPAAAVMVATQAVVAIGQVMEQSSIGWHGLGEHHLDPVVGGISIVTGDNGERLLRGYGLADHPNILGGLLAFGLLSVIAFLPAAGDLVRGLAVPVIALGTLALALTFSRGAILAFVIAIVAAVVALVATRSFVELQWWGVAAAAGMLMVVLVAEPYGGFFLARADATSSASATEQRSISERSALVDVTNDLIVDRPFLGTGLATVPVAMREAEPEFDFNYQPAHVVVLDVAAETGLAGGLSYSLLVGAPWVVIAARRRLLTPAVIGASALFGSVLLTGLVDYYTWTYPAGQFWFWLSLAVWAAVYQEARDG